MFGRASVPRLTIDSPSGSGLQVRRGRAVRRRLPPSKHEHGCVVSAKHNAAAESGKDALSWAGEHRARATITWLLWGLFGRGAERAKPARRWRRRRQ